MHFPLSKKVLVAGGAGFIGSHLCKQLLDLGQEVTCLDNYSTGSKQNVSHLLENPHFHLMEHDVTVPFFVDVNQIYNLACPASPKWYQRDPLKTLKTSVLGSINLLELAVQVKARILLASTSEVYGDPEVHPQPEHYRGNVSTTGPRACYDEGKRCAETLFSDYHRQKNVDTRIARIFNTYGPGMHPNDGRVISNFIVQALSGQKLTIYGTGSQTRSFCFVSDLVEGLIRLMNHPGLLTEPINLGNPCEFSIADLAEKILKLTGSHSSIMYLPLPQDDPLLRQPNISKAFTKLEWKPTVPLDNGLMVTIDYFKRSVTGKNINGNGLSP